LIDRVGALFRACDRTRHCRTPGCTVNGQIDDLIGQGQISHWIVGQRDETAGHDQAAGGLFQRTSASKPASMPELVQIHLGLIDQLEFPVVQCLRNSSTLMSVTIGLELT
jgi:hypothetical protein